MVQHGLHLVRDRPARGGIDRREGLIIQRVEGRVAVVVVARRAQCSRRLDLQDVKRGVRDRRKDPVPDPQVVVSGVPNADHLVVRVYVVSGIAPGIRRLDAGLREPRGDIDGRGFERRIRVRHVESERERVGPVRLVERRRVQILHARGIVPPAGGVQHGPRGLRIEHEPIARRDRVMPRIRVRDQGVRLAAEPEQGVLDDGRLVDAHGHRLADRVVEEELVVVRASRLVLRIRGPDLRRHDVHIKFGDKPGIRSPLLESVRVVSDGQSVQVVCRAHEGDRVEARGS